MNTSMTNITNRLNHKAWRRPLDIKIIGSPCEHIVISPSAVSLTHHCVEIVAEQHTYQIPYDGEPINWGEKRTARGDLAAFRCLLGATVRTGGGQRNTAIFMKMLADRVGLGVCITAVDTAKSVPRLDREFARAGIWQFSIAIEPCPVNIIVIQAGSTHRLILTSPTQSAVLSASDECEIQRAVVGARLDAVLINSPKSRFLAEAALKAARSVNRPIYSLVTRSLAVADRRDLLVRPASVAVMSLSEFHELSRCQGIPCEDDESKVTLTGLAAALAQFSLSIEGNADFVVTLGHAGFVAFDRVTSITEHVCLNANTYATIQRIIAGRPERALCAGDEFFASMCLHHLRALRNPVPLRCPTLWAARRAMIDVVNNITGGRPVIGDRSLSSSLRPMTPGRALWPRGPLLPPPDRGPSAAPASVELAIA